jgi:hypothetical protein
LNNFDTFKKVGLVIALIANPEVTLNDYKYPIGAHIIGYVIVVIILSPLPIFAFLAIKNLGFKQVRIDERRK